MAAKVYYSDQRHIPNKWKQLATEYAALMPDAFEVTVERTLIDNAQYTYYMTTRLKWYATSNLDLAQLATENLPKHIKAEVIRLFAETARNLVASANSKPS